MAVIPFSRTPAFTRAQNHQTAQRTLGDSLSLLTISTKVDDISSTGAERCPSELVRFFVELFDRN